MDRSISEKPHVNVSVDEDINIVSQFSSVYAPSVDVQTQDMRRTLDFDGGEGSVFLAEEEAATGLDLGDPEMLANYPAPDPSIRNMESALYDGVNENRPLMQGPSSPRRSDFADLEGTEVCEDVHAPTEIVESQSVFTASGNTSLANHDTRNIETSLRDGADIVDVNSGITDNMSHEETDNSGLALMCVQNSAEAPSLDPERFFQDVRHVFRKRYLTESSLRTKERSKKVQKLLLAMVEPKNTKTLESGSFSTPLSGSRNGGLTPGRMLEEIRNSRALLELYEPMFPRSIWKCCSSLCFFLNMSNPQLVRKLSKIHKTATALRKAIEAANELVAPRQKGDGCSTIGFTAPNRNQREMEESQVVTHKEAAQQRLVRFATESLAFLRGGNLMSSASSDLRLNHKLCINGTCIILGVSRNFLYTARKRPVRGSDLSIMPCNTNSTGQENPSSSPLQPNNAVLSIIDSAGAREREFRRIGSRCGFPALREMTTFDCGCEQPCFAKMPLFQLENHYQRFLEVSKHAPRRRRENQFLLNIMFCPLSNSVERKCDKAIANLFTVSKSLVSEIRRTLKLMCEDPELENRPLRDDWRKNGYSCKYHPANRMSDSVRERIENHLDMVLRPDPAGGNEVGICRVYSPEINTHEKLRKTLLTLLDSDEGSTERPKISSSTLGRRIEEYLGARCLRIAYQQTDHNACPTCKTLKYATFQFFRQYKHMERKEQQLIRETEEGDSVGKQDRIEELRIQIKDKKDQEAEALAEYRAHCERDRRIRGAIKRLSDHFRSTENELIQKRTFTSQHPPWCSLKNHATITHQDDMTKVDLPYFMESASADITRWRFGINAHVSAVNGDAVVFSHEQGTGAKNSGCIFEEILLDHLVRCRGEAIKVVVSDNASVGKNWVTAVAMPQYLVDQGLASIAIIIFLENNHGKWLADMLFGQLQTRRKRTNLLSIDDLLSEFEAVNRTVGRIHGFALNPLSSINFSEVLTSLGYETKPPKGLNFTKRNIHFAVAAASGAQNEISSNLKRLLDPLLPDEPGMVRLCSNPPGAEPQNSLPYEDRYFDVPAAALTPATTDGVLSEQSCLTPSVQVETDSVHVELHSGGSGGGAGTNEMQNETNATETASTSPNVPLVVPLGLAYSKGGNGVVSKRTADNVGFNGISFRNNAAFPEIMHLKSDIVRRAWPVGLITRPANVRNHPRSTSEQLKCAPENWVMRRPISNIIADREEPVARYPPRNLLNAKFKQGPREEFKWVPTATYPEPPFPVVVGTCASSAMRKLSLLHNKISQSVHVLRVIKVVFEDMGRTDQEASDPWLQNRVTMPSQESIKKFLEELQLFIKREKGYPKAPLSVKQAFKQDKEICAKVEESLSSEGAPKSGKAKTQKLNEMFQQAEDTPGALERFEYIVEKDLERFSKELQVYKVKLLEFDKNAA